MHYSTAPHATPKTVTEYSPPWGSLLTKEQLFRALLIRGSKAGPPRVRQPHQIDRVRGNVGMLIQSLSLEREFEMPYVVFEVRQRRLARGIPSRESIEPSNPIE